MPHAELPEDHLTEYERAICYYTLPRVKSPVTFGAVMVYAVLLLQAIIALLYGVFSEKQGWLTGGAIALFSIVALGCLVFVIRALLNAVRERRALAAADGVPDAAEGDPDLPDPFAGHLLIKHPVGVRGHLFSCTSDDAALLYFVDSPQASIAGLSRRRPALKWNVRTRYDTEYCQIHVVRGLPSFTLDPSMPGRLSVTTEGREVARVSPRFSMRTIAEEIEYLTPEPRKYRIRRQGIYFEGRLVGRIYCVRQSFYLDIEQEHFNEGILAYFVVRS